MNRAFNYAFCLVGTMVLSACSTVETQQPAQGMAQNSTRIELTQALHFLSPDGSDVVVQAGTYRVEQATGSQIRLIPVGSTQDLVLSSREMIWNGDVPASNAFLVPLEGDVQQIVMLVPNQSALEARGSLNAVQTRGLQHLDIDMTKQVRINGPDLVARCVNKLVFQGAYYYFSVVTNRGNVVAGPSQAVLAAQSMAVPSLQPGEYRALARSSSGPAYPEGLRVDSQNVVAESNETNNTGGLCP